MSKLKKKSKKPDSIVIENFGWLEPSYMSIDVHALYDDESDTTVYNAVLILHLDDGEDDDSKGIIMQTDVYNECYHCCARQAAMSVLVLFGDNLIDNIAVCDDECEQFDELYIMSKFTK